MWKSTPKTTIHRWTGLEKWTKASDYIKNNFKNQAQILDSNLIKCCSFRKGWVHFVVTPTLSNDCKTVFSRLFSWLWRGYLFFYDYGNDSSKPVQKCLGVRGDLDFVVSNVASAILIISTFVKREKTWIPKTSSGRGIHGIWAKLKFDQERLRAICSILPEPMESSKSSMLFYLPMHPIRYGGRWWTAFAKEWPTAYNRRSATWTLIISLRGAAKNLSRCPE